MDTTKHGPGQQLRVIFKSFNEKWGPLLALGLAILIGIIVLSGN